MKRDSDSGEYLENDSDESLTSESDDESMESDSDENLESDSNQILYGVKNPKVKSLLFWNLPAVKNKYLEELADDFVEHIEKKCPYAIILNRWPKHRTVFDELAACGIEMDEDDIDAPICSYMVVHFQTRDQADRVYKRLRHTKYSGNVINVQYTRVPTFTK